MPVCFRDCGLCINVLTIIIYPNVLLSKTIKILSATCLVNILLIVIIHQFSLTNKQNLIIHIQIPIALDNLCLIHIKTIWSLIKRSENVIKRTENVIKRTENVIKRTENVIKRTENVIKRSENVIKRSENVIKRTENVIKRTENVIKRIENVIKTFWWEFLISCYKDNNEWWNWLYIGWHYNWFIYNNLRRWDYERKSH